MSSTSKKPYDPHLVEEKIYRAWERVKAFSPKAKPKRGSKPFSIVIPPPNVTGSLHMGHALNASMQDALTRYHRMKGDDTVWIPGMDHAGIATQNVVEKSLKKEGQTRFDLGREKFTERVWQWKEQYGKTIGSQLRRLGSSCDWSRERFTMDPDYVRAVQEAFIHYAKKGLIYRGDRIVNWCSRCASSISDLEVKYEEQNGLIYNISYPLADGSGEITVATTRPETMLGDTAVAVYPGDERYKNLIDKKIKLPLAGREIPIVADYAVEKEFGTGAVKVTPAHDNTDWEIGQRHQLEIINVIGEDGKMTKEAGPEYTGMGAEEARVKVVEKLRASNFLKNEPEQYRHKVALCDRCGTVIQPLVSKQWFVKMKPLAEPAMEAARKELIKFYPVRWKKNYLEWLAGVKDWCVSRQLWWGHRLPVWYCQTGKMTNYQFPMTNMDGGHVVFSVSKPKKCPECGGTDFVQDQDVLDTWFSSALWPFAVFGWPEATEELKRYYPTSVLFTARDIMALWVARMVFSGLEFMDRKKYLPAKQYRKTNMGDQIPFKNVIIHPTVLNLKGQRMSKSLGTGIDPMDLINQYGADATRFGLLIQTQLDQQALRFDENAVRTGRNFVNKLWNIGRLLEVTGYKGLGRGVPGFSSVFDNWIINRNLEVTAEITKALEEFRFGDALRVLHSFVWDDFADWYLEVLKVEGMANPKVAWQVFQDILRLAHPFMPYVTEELWKNFGSKKEMLIVSDWPVATKSKSAKKEMKDIVLFQKIVRELRSMKNLLGIAPSVRTRVKLKTEKRVQTLFAAVSFLANVEVAATKESEKEWANVPASGDFNVSIEKNLLRNLPLRERIESIKKEIEKMREEVAGIKSRIEKMAGKAPEEVVAEQRIKMEIIARNVNDKSRSLAEIEELTKSL